MDIKLRDTVLSSNPAILLKFLSTLGEAILFFDEQGSILLANDVFFELVNVPKSRIKNEDVRSFLLSEEGEYLTRDNWPLTFDAKKHKMMLRLPTKGTALEVWVRAQKLDTDFYVVALQPQEKLFVGRPKRKLFDAASRAATSQETHAQHNRNNAAQDEHEDEQDLVIEHVGKQDEVDEQDVQPFGSIQGHIQDIWDQLQSKDAELTKDDYRAALKKVAHLFNAQLSIIELAQHPEDSKLITAQGEEILFPFTFKSLRLTSSDGAVKIVTEQNNPDVADWFYEHKRTGFVVLLSHRNSVTRDFVISRPLKEGKFTNLEVTLYKRFVQNAYIDFNKSHKQAQDTFISSTLQKGLGNRIQDIAGITACGLYNSATSTASIGGDFYTVFELPGRRACIVLGDVTGKGVEAASVSSAIKTALGAYAWEGLTPSYMVRSLNDFFMSFSRLETFATMFVGILSIETGELVYCSAGHLPGLIVKQRSNDIVKLTEQSGVVGAFSEMIYTDGYAQLSPGDTLLLYTDGVTEARRSDGTFLGEYGLRDRIVRHIHEPIEELPEAFISEIFAFTGNVLEDDVAFLAVRFDG